MIAGVLLAAGEGTRFGGAKLGHPLPDGTPLGVASARNLAGAGLDRCLAVVAPGDVALARQLKAAGLEVLVCSASARGMGASLAAGVRETAGADGWVVALADMPWIAPATIGAVAEALRQGAALAAPFQGERGGHPVGFGAELGAELRALDGDVGARGIVQAHRERLTPIPVADPGVVQDVDAPEDLDGGQSGEAR